MAAPLRPSRQRASALIIALGVLAAAVGVTLSLVLRRALCVVALAADDVHVVAEAVVRVRVSHVRRHQNDAFDHRFDPEGPGLDAEALVRDVPGQHKRCRTVSHFREALSVRSLSSLAGAHTQRGSTSSVRVRIPSVIISPQGLS